MTSSINGEVLTIFLEGRIDSSNANQLGAEIDEIVAGNIFTQLVLDFDKLEYISSAGLRILLKLRKVYPGIKLINVSSDVYDVLEMTGMSEMLDITKAFRRISIEGCEAIGQGSNGKVYRIDPDTIVKVYRDPNSLPDIRRERELARKAFVMGIPTAIPYDVVRVGDSYGSVFELLNAKSFSKLIAADPSREDELVAEFVDIMHKLHSTHIKPDDMPGIKETAVKWAYFVKDYIPVDQGEKLISLMENVPERDTMLHGDYHTNNVMMQGNEALLIDMDTLCYGHPVFELGSSYMGFVAFGENDPKCTESFLKMPYTLACDIWNKVLHLYLAGHDEEYIRSVERKAMIVAYTRLLRRTVRRIGINTAEGASIVSYCRKHLAECLAVTDTLDF